MAQRVRDLLRGEDRTYGIIIQTAAVVAAILFVLAVVEILWAR
jgi:hypothetical protein